MLLARIVVGTNITTCLLSMTALKAALNAISVLHNPHPRTEPVHRLGGFHIPLNLYQ